MKGLLGLMEVSKTQYLSTSISSTLNPCGGQTPVGNIARKDEAWLIIGMDNSDINNISRTERRRPSSRRAKNIIMIMKNVNLLIISWTFSDNKSNLCYPHICQKHAKLTLGGVFHVTL